MPHPAPKPAQVLCFQSIYTTKRLEFPCSVDGSVWVESLPPHAAANYQYAREMLGREYLAPVVKKL
jgi:hypothetical protein